MTQENLTRRQVLERGGALTAGLAGLGLAGFVGYDWPRKPAAGAAKAASPSASPATVTEVQRFVTRSDLRPPIARLTRIGRSPATPRFIFVSTKGYPVSGPGQAGNMILDRDGSVVWFSPSGQESRLGFTVQTYRGRPVLTWWQGKVTTGHGAGVGVIADESYRTIAIVRAGNGLHADLHEFAITPQGTALVTAYTTAPADLSGLGGPRRGTVLNSIAQEVDIVSGRVLFEWDSLSHVRPDETYVPFSEKTSKAPFDYFHINSIAIAPDGGLLISSRNTCTVYKVDRPSGKVVWRLGGKKSDFSMGPGSRFYFQHHVRPQGASSLSIFDDGGAPPREERQSRAIILDLDTTTRRATLHRQYLHPAGIAAANQGSAQVLPDGRMFVGWGNQPYFSEFTEDGTIDLDGELPIGDQSYRAFTQDWHGKPTELPAVMARPNQAGGTVVYASWNGATEVDSWSVHAGKTLADLVRVGSQERTGFETPVAVNSTGPYFAVVAYDARGRALGRSAIVRVRRA